MLDSRQRVPCHVSVVRRGEARAAQYAKTLSGGDQINSYRDRDGLVLMSRSGSARPAGRRERAGHNLMVAPDNQGTRDSDTPGYTHSRPEGAIRMVSR